MFTGTGRVRPFVNLLMLTLFVFSGIGASACHKVGDVMTICGASGFETVYIDRQNDSSSSDQHEVDSEPSCCDTGLHKTALSAKRASLFAAPSDSLLPPRQHIHLPEPLTRSYHSRAPPVSANS